MTSIGLNTQQHVVWRQLSACGWGGATDEELAVETGIDKTMVTRWRQAWVREGWVEQTTRKPGPPPRQKVWKRTDKRPQFHQRTAHGIVLVA